MNSAARPALLDRARDRRGREAARATDVPLDARIAVIKKQLGELAESFKARLIAYKLDQIPEGIRKDVSSCSELTEEKRNPIQKYLAEKLADHFAFKEDSFRQHSRNTRRRRTQRRPRSPHWRRGGGFCPGAGLTDMASKPLPFYLQTCGEPYNRGDEVSPNVPGRSRKHGQVRGEAAVARCAFKRAAAGVRELADGPERPGASLDGPRVGQPGRQCISASGSLQPWTISGGRGRRRPISNCSTGSPPNSSPRGWSIKKLHTLIVTSTRSFARARDGAARERPTPTIGCSVGCRCGGSMPKCSRRDLFCLGILEPQNVWSSGRGRR